MKTPISPTGFPGLVLALLMASAPCGLTQSKLDRSSTVARDATPAATPTRAALLSALPATIVPPHVPSEAVGAMPDNVFVQGKPLPSNIQLSPWLTDIVKLARAGLEDEVMLTFIDSIGGTFNLGADQIIYLSDLGVSGQVIAAMLCHDFEIASGLRPVTASTAPMSQPALQFVFATKSDASVKPVKQPAPMPAPSPLVISESAYIRSREPLPDVNHHVTSARYRMADKLEPGRPSPLSQKAQAPAEKPELYPVRKPYPVPLTAPILVINAWGRTPNTLVLELRY